MIKFNSYSSGSKGNFYILSDGKTELMIECGIIWKNIIKSLNYNIENISACLISHSHSDHSKAAKNVIKNGIDVYTSIETSKELNLEGHRVKAIEPLKQFKVGTFTILPFDLQHDAYNLGFLIVNKQGERFLYITDSYYCKYKFKKVNLIAIECNYSKEILEANIGQGLVPMVLSKRLIKSHFSLDNVKEFLKANDLSQVKDIVLIHLSDGNSNAKQFHEEIERLTGIPTYVADKGLEIEL